MKSDRLTAKEAWVYLNVSRSTFRRLVDAGVIPVQRITKRTHRYKRADLDRYLESVTS